MKKRKCSACSIEKDINNTRKNIIVCKSCYNKNKRKNKNNTLPTKTVTTSHQQRKKENVNENNNKIRTLIIGFSNCGKSYLMNHILTRKQEPIFTKYKIIKSIS